MIHKASIPLFADRGRISRASQASVSTTYKSGALVTKLPSSRTDDDNISTEGYEMKDQFGLDTERGVPVGLAN